MVFRLFRRLSSLIRVSINFRYSAREASIVSIFSRSFDIDCWSLLPMVDTAELYYSSWGYSMYVINGIKNWIRLSDACLISLTLS